MQSNLIHRRDGMKFSFVCPKTHNDTKHSIKFRHVKERSVLKMRSVSIFLHIPLSPSNLWRILLTLRLTLCETKSWTTANTHTQMCTKHSNTSQTLTQTQRVDFIINLLHVHTHTHIMKNA